MTKKKTKEVATEADAALLAQLAEQFPQETGVARLFLPRLTFKSQDVLEGKGKNKTVVIEAGTFFTEKTTDEKDENGKMVWDKQELGLAIEGHIIFQRKQLRFYDEPNEQFYSTPIFDEMDAILPLFCGSKKVATGTPAELKKSFEFTNPEGKTRSKLEDNVVLYILYAGVLYQMSLRGSSMYSFKDYARKTTPSTVITAFASTAQEKGTIEWNQMQFTSLRAIDAQEAQLAIEQQNMLRDAIAAEKTYYASTPDQTNTVAAVLALPGGDEEDF